MTSRLFAIVLGKKIYPQSSIKEMSENNTSLTEQSKSNNGKGHGDTKVEESKASHQKLKRWPSDNTETVEYAEIIGPIKKIIEQGYRIVRNNRKEFEYDGYNIGRQEQQFIPPLNHRFTEKVIDYENKKCNRTLLDIALQTLYLLGIEQGRRLHRRERMPVAELVEAMDKYRKDNRRLRAMIDALEIKNMIKEDFAELSPEDLQQFVQFEVNARKEKRAQIAKAELGEDPLKSWGFILKKKMQFQKLEKIAKEINGKCSEEEWKEILVKNEWTIEEWTIKAKKKNISIEFKK